MNLFKKTFTFFVIIILVCAIFSSSVNGASSSRYPIYWGAWVGSSHIGNYNLLATFEGQVGKGVSIWNWIQLWNRPQDSENIPNFDAALMDQCRNHGAIPMVSWSPEAGNGGMFSSLQDIIDGKCDAYLTAWGQASAKWGHPYFVRLMWEFTGSWTDYTTNNGYGIYPWDSGIGNTPAKFVQAWQHIVNVVRNAGGNQISWVWCPGDVGDSVSTLQSVYPGDKYVDWVGTDIYGDLVHSGDVELANIHAMADKPVMIPEIGWSGTDKGEYWNTLLTNTLPNQYPYIKAVVIWDMPSTGLTVVDPPTLSSFKDGIGTNYYLSNNYFSLNVSPLNALSLTNPIPDSPTQSPTITAASSSSNNLPIITAITVSITVAGVILIALLKAQIKPHKKNKTF